MKLFCLLTVLAFSRPLLALNDYLKPEDQPFYQNDANGKNNLDRIDSNVKEINRMWGEINTLKNEISLIKEQLAAIKAAKAAVLPATKKP